jgi:outer membrane receptor protein involved in Fe transport
VWVSDALTQYQNCDAANSDGLEFEVGGHPVPWLDMTAGLSLNRAVNANLGKRLPNVPSAIAKARAAVPLWRDRLFFSGEYQRLGPRSTGLGTVTRPVNLVDAALSTSKLAHGLDFVAGVRNALNWRYTDPLNQPLDPTVDQIPAAGRSAFFKLIWRQSQ